MDAPNLPWFRDPRQDHPFRPFTLLSSTDKRAFHCLAPFPWTTQSIDELWEGPTSDPNLLEGWKKVAGTWMGSVIVGGTGSIYVYPKLATEEPYHLQLDESDAQVLHVAWALNSSAPIQPLIIFAVGSVIMLLDVTSLAIVGQLRGHGGPITSIAVHPTQPNIFCTTSKDFTTRIYDVSLTPVNGPNNSHWPPSTNPSLAGPAHGLDMHEPEGVGLGRCVAVMVGGRSGGHRAAVSCSAFHPSLPLIATGGVDRAIKIWFIPPSAFQPTTPPTLAREDKPLFSTDLLHKACVFSVEWVMDDILISCSAPSLMRREDAQGKTYLESEEGTVVLWHWLSLCRFFPPGVIHQMVMRGAASDWRNSESFKILGAYHLPERTRHVDIFKTFTHDPMLSIPFGKSVKIFNINMLKARNPPSFPLDDIVLPMQMVTLDDTAAELHAHPLDKTGSSQQAEPGSQHAKSKGRQATMYPAPAPLAMIDGSVEGWEVVAPITDGSAAESPDISVCVMGFNGLGLVAIGEKGTLYVWRLNQ